MTKSNGGPQQKPTNIAIQSTESGQGNSKLPNSESIMLGNVFIFHESLSAKYTALCFDSESEGDSEVEKNDYEQEEELDLFTHHLPKKSTPQNASN